jgi:hypothetical protein
MSLAFAARMSLRASANASWMVVRAWFLASTESVASVRDEILAARAASSGDAFVRDILAVCIL